MLSASGRCGRVVMESSKSGLAGNFEAVESRICEACARSGRERSEVTLIAVSKTVDAAAVREAAALGQLDFGENYVKPAQSKLEEVKALGGSEVRFHMIGHLQRNKVRPALGVFESLHSLDSVRLLNALGKELGGGEREFPCFVEVNVSGEDSKYGVSPDDAQGLVETALETDGVKIEGLMTMAPYLAQPEDCRPYFARLRELRDKINDIIGRKALRSLSMGMTNDFEVAVEEGATHLRIGTALFGT